MERRQFIALAALGAAATSLPQRLAALTPAVAPGTPIKVYKSPTCGCCKSWVSYMGQNGFQVDAVDLDDNALDAIKRRYGVPGPLQSCHTAIAGKYVVEGHVPADLVHRILRERPAALGLSVPGMVTGSPGMDGPNPQHYDVIIFQKDGSSRSYATR
jgi:hypothetical protein